MSKKTIPPAVYKETSPTGELLVWMNGSLLYKTWPNGTSMVFEQYGPPTTNTDRDKKG